jgi:ligand-binding SRPBCC domain-containing protein
MKTAIRAPAERCFDLSLSVDLHLASASSTGERAVAGVTSGLIGLGEEVTWRARHFGIVFHMTSRITAADRPRFFRDRMVRGPFASFEHDHRFDEEGDVTWMRDELRFEAPLGWLGKPAGLWVVRPHLRRFLAERNEAIKAVAESADGWRAYVTP